MWSVTTCRLLQEGGGGDAGSRGHRDESLIPRTPQMPGLSSPVTGGSCLPSVQGGKRLQGLRFSCLPLEDRVTSLARCSRGEKALQALPPVQLCACQQPARGPAGAPALALAALLTQGSAPPLSAPSPSVKTSKSEGRPPPGGPCQDWAARPPMCLQPLTVPGLPQWTGRVGFLSVCRWMTSASWTHSSVHPLAHCPSSTQLLLHTFAPSPLTASLIHTASQARLGPPVHILSEAPPLTPATTVTSILHRFQPAWCGCHLEVPHLGPGHIHPLPAQSFPFSVTWDPTRTRVAHTSVRPTGAGASVPGRHPLDSGIRKPPGKCSPPGQTVLRHILQASQRSLGIKQSVTHSNDRFTKETFCYPKV